MKNNFSGVVKSLSDAVHSAAGTASNAVTDAKNYAQKAGLELGEVAGTTMESLAGAASDFASKAGNSISDSGNKCIAAVKSGAAAAGDSAASGAKLAGATLGAVAGSAENVLSAAAVLVGDLNGDGKVDFEDAKIAAAKVKEAAGAAAAELGQLGKSALQSKLVQDAAAGAVVGGVLASGIPFVGTATGATVGAALGVYKSIGTK